MKKVVSVLVVVLLLVVFATSASAWKEKYEDDFIFPEVPGAKIKVGSVVSGGWFFQPPNAVNFVAAVKPARAEETVVKSTTNTAYFDREGKCPLPDQTRSVGWGNRTTTTTTVVKTMESPKVEVKHASSHTGRAPLETILPAIAGIGQQAVGGYFFKEGMRVLRPDNMNIQQEGGGATAYGGHGYGGAGGQGGQGGAGGTGYGGQGGGGGNVGPIAIDVPINVQQQQNQRLRNQQMQVQVPICGRCGRKHNGNCHH